MKDLKELYESLNESERFGLQFGLFPIKLKGLTKEEEVKLMEFSEVEG